jgi:hypothetical protein
MKGEPVKGVLTRKRDLGVDYELRKGENYVWITVGNLSVRVKRENEGVSVDVYGKGKETDDPLATAWAIAGARTIWTRSDARATLQSKKER